MDESMDESLEHRLAQLRRLQSQFGRVWQALRKRESRPCVVCGTIMPNVVGNRRYCSAACQARAWRMRHPEYREKKRRLRHHQPPQGEQRTTQEP